VWRDWRRLRSRKNRPPLRQEKNASLKNNGPAGWAVHPGEILREEFLEPMNISPYRLALDLEVSPPTLNDIVREKWGNHPGDGNSPSQVFRQLGAVLAQPAGRFCGVSRLEKYSKELKANQDSGGGRRDGEGRARTDAPAARCRTVAARAPVGRSDGTSVHVIGGLAFDRPDIFRLLLKRIDVHHPAEYLRHKFSAGGFTSIFGRD